MREFQYRCELKQITPLIHFQHEQEGATLRATEVKPKLDRFLLQALNLLKVERKRVPRTWVLLSPDQHDAQAGENIAFNYKLRFWADANSIVKSDMGETEIYNAKIPIDNGENRRVPKQKIAKLYFGNMASGKPRFQTALDRQRRIAELQAYENEVLGKYKETVFYTKPILIEVVSLAQGELELPVSNGAARTFSLLSLIRELLPLFFDIYAFGTRQTKGFGCFQVNDSKKTDASLLTLCDFFPVHYLLSYQSEAAKVRDDIGRANDALDKIWGIYGSMRSGFNLNKQESGRIRGFALQYANHTMGVLNDKQFVRKYMVNLSPLLPDNPAHYRLVRAMLGLTSDFKYAKGDGGTPLGKNIFVEDALKNSDSDRSVMRFASPIRFHVRFQNSQMQIYMLPIVESVKRMENKTFLIQVKGRDNTRKAIQTPSHAEFNIIDFLDSFIAYFNNKSNFSHLKHKDLVVLTDPNLTIQRIPQGASV